MESAQVKKRCKRPGCGQFYTDAENGAGSCSFHNGKPIFHDLKKGWTCCGQEAWEWSEFEKLKGCCLG